MAALIIGIVSFGVIIAGTTAFARVALESGGDSAAAIRSAARSVGETARSHLTSLAACQVGLGSTIRLTIVNSGQEPLHDFDEWDLIAFYNTASGEVSSRPAYTTSAAPSAGQWTVSAILDPAGNPEVIGRGVIDPGEQAQIVVELAQSVWASSNNLIRISTGAGSSLSVDISGASACGFYLHNSNDPPTSDTASSVGLPASSTQPSQTALFNYDTDRDAQAGLVIATGGAGPGESNATRYQNWLSAPLADDLDLAGVATLQLWAAAADFSATSTGAITAYLRDYDGAGYTEIATGAVSASPWDPGSTGNFIKTTISFSAPAYTVAAGHQLEIKLIVGAGADAPMWLAYDTLTYPAYLELPYAADLFAHSDTRAISSSVYYQLQTSPHNGGYFLHNNPSPPTGDTSAQANLPATHTYPGTGTLANYDKDLDAVAGRTLALGGSGAAESDITKYQNWRTDALAGPVTLNGTVRVQVWSAMSGFDTVAAGELVFYLRDFDGAAYTDVASSTVTAAPWDSPGSGAWVKTLAEIPVSSYTVAAGRQLEIKVIVGAAAASSMLIAYDTTDHPAVLKLPGDTETTPAGLPQILQADTQNQIGRTRPSPNDGKLTFPLAGYSEISASEWTVTYRVKTADPPTGFQYFAAATDVTPGTAGQWLDIDLSAVVPVDTTGAVVEIVNNHPSNALSGVVRGKADTRDYMASAGNQTLGGKGHRWQVVKVDGNRLIQGYVEDTVNVSIKVVGYTFGVDPKFVDVPPDITPATTGAWTAVDVTAQVDADADGVILMLDSTGNDSAYAIREIGSADNDTLNVISGQGNALYMVGIDGNDQFEAYLSAADVKFYLVAQTRGSVVFNITDVAVPDPSLNSWQQIDATLYGVPTIATGVLLHTENEQNKRNAIGLRRGDSTDDWNKELSQNAHYEGVAGLNSQTEWGQFQGSNNVTVSVAAYTLGAPVSIADIHADVDVLVRTVTGNIRSVLGTHVATTTDIAAAGWLTKTATFTPVAYQVVDSTDYLEIDLFEDVTGNEANSTVLYFMIDDNSVPATQQTGIQNVALKRD